MIRLILPLIVCLTLPAYGADGLITLPSRHDVGTTVDRLESSVKGAGFSVVARIDHAHAAAGVDMALAPNQLLIFGKPKAGSLLMQQAPSMGIDLPMKYLVWRDAEGNVLIGWNDPSWLAARHGMAGTEPVIAKMAAALQGFASAAAGSE